MSCQNMSLEPYWKREHHFSSVMMAVKDMLVLDSVVTANTMAYIMKWFGKPLHPLSLLNPIRSGLKCAIKLIQKSWYWFALKRHSKGTISEIETHPTCSLQGFSWCTPCVWPFGWTLIADSLIMFWSPKEHLTTAQAVPTRITVRWSPLYLLFLLKLSKFLRLKLLC